MMKFVFSLFFLTLLCLWNVYWLIQISFFLLTFLFFFCLSYDSKFVGLSMGLGLDLLSFMMILLSFWICSLMILASMNVYKTGNYPNLFVFVILVLMLSLFLAFSSMNLMVFYLFFEVSLIPTLILILGWGYQPERLEAGMYLLFYTMFVSLPMMVSIFMYYSSYNTLEFPLMTNQLMSWFMYLCMNMVFFIKIPMFFVHLWLPKAHVEAPVSGSMILAGVMLKLGGYGLIRLLKIFVFISVDLNYIFISISLVGGVYVSFICLRQSDIKSLIAYSSVAHMSLVLSGILTLNTWGFWGSLCLMVAHGLCSSGLFCLANMVYERTGSRSLYLNKGMVNVIPSLGLWWFLLCSSNMAAPPSLNLLGEISLINSLVMYSKLSMFFLSFISFFSAAYSLYIYSFIQHGINCSGKYTYSEGTFREYLLLFLHWFPLNTMILMGDFLMYIV
uniref:NADH-ubiquinone oxidoreductase chain 4 n=1 Tax=Apoderinae sp. 2 AV-2018 TaxID=2480750 RepID=A0A3G2JZB6_9CUCU|nr:NADH dehydrogenase subunit 4 [Apoderinae sp. 2 AV-2018]